MSDLLETTEGGIAWLKLNRPDRLNAFSPAMLEALGEALQRLASDAEVGAIVVTGARTRLLRGRRCQDDGEPSHPGV
jgi:2-(1,2-epoxy-1,2-dihydrophenyl)acetyl-CoA isomerase